MLHTLIVEDEFTGRMILSTLLLPHGRCDVARDGREALEAFAAALESGERYGLVCLDINMPGELDGHAVLRAIREMERGAGLASAQRVKVVMTSASGDAEDVVGAFRSECDAYLVKPIDRVALHSKLSQLGLLARSERPDP
jgi:two-component system, chemotaxis family, chemotaxis protein CheY